LKQIEKKKKATISQISYIAALKYAAVALIFLIVGALLFYKPNKTISPVYSFDFEKQLNISQSQLIRSNGDNIILKDKRAILTYKKTGELVINNDTLKSTDELKYENTNSIKKQSFNQLIIPYGKTSEILLSDGTKVILNAGSSLVFPELFTGESREVFLYGEAFFDVKHDSDHPFVVNVNNLRITDLGTSFNISAYPSDGRIETLLTEGKLSIRNNNEGLYDKATELIPGQLA
jgi:transmembrane sensor